MGMQETIDALKRVQEIAALAGLKGQINDNAARFEMGFALEGGRSQMVYVRPIGEGPNRKQIVMFFSPARVIKKGLLGSISKDDAVTLLKLNQTTYFARFGISESKDELLVVASIDHILDTLDPDEFQAASWSVASAADAYESKYGKDAF